MIEINLTTNLLPSVAELVGTNATDAVQATATAISARAKAKIRNGPKTGAISRRHGRTHQASAPGEPPANDTGRLANEIYTRHVSAAESIVVSPTEYGGKYLERGSPGGKIKPRPYMAPSVEEERPAFLQRIADAMNAAASATASSLIQGAAEE